MPLTLYDKIWNDHLVHQQDGGTALVYVDRHLIHEVTSPQAFEGLRNSGREVRKPKYTFAVADHNVPTSDRSQGITNKESRIQVETLENNFLNFEIYRKDEAVANQGEDWENYASDGEYFIANVSDSNITTYWNIELSQNFYYFHFFPLLFFMELKQLVP